MTFETEKDKSNQLRAARLIEKSWGALVNITDDGCGYDYKVMRDGRLIFIGEYKHRTCGVATYTTLAISFMKVQDVQTEAFELGVRPILFVEWVDGLYWIDMREDYTTAMGGRSPRPDGHSDRELMAHYPIHRFALVPGDDPPDPELHLGQPDAGNPADDAAHEDDDGKAAHGS